MERCKATLEKDLSFNPDRPSLQRAFRSIASRIDRLNPPRSPPQSQAREGKTYDSSRSSTTMPV